MKLTTQYTDSRLELVKGERKEREARTCISCHEEFDGPEALLLHPYYEERWCETCLAWWDAKHREEHEQSLRDQEEERTGA